MQQYHSGCGFVGWQDMPLSFSDWQDSLHAFPILFLCHRILKFEIVFIIYWRSWAPFDDQYGAGWGIVFFIRDKCCLLELLWPEDMRDVKTFLHVKDHLKALCKCKQCMLVLNQERLLCCSCLMSLIHLRTAFFLRNNRILVESYLLVSVRLKMQFRQLGKYSSMSQIFTGLDCPWNLVFNYF